jgi:predicted ArsR family transcriptional regulator
MSAAQMAKVVRLSANKLSHHLQVLKDFDLVTLVDVQKVRGVEEKFFVSQVTGHATVEVILTDTEEEDRHLKY